MSIPLTEIMTRLGARLPESIDLPAGLLISRLNTLADAQPDEISFLANSRYQSQLAHTRAAAVLLQEQDWLQLLASRLGQTPAAHPATPSFIPLLVDRPYVAFAHLSQLFEQLAVQAPPTSAKSASLIHPDAAIDPSAITGPAVRIAAGVCVGAHVVIGAGCELAANAVIGNHVILGEDCRIGAGAVIEARCQLGQRVRVHANAVIGADGFGFAPDFTADPDQSSWVRIAQLGRVIIGDDCRIGASSNIDRGALGDTVLGRGVLLDNQIQIGHNVHIGDLTAIAAATAVAGSTRIGRRCRIAGAVAIAGHLNIADDVQIDGMSMVSGHITKAGSYASGTALTETAIWRRNAVRARQLDRLLNASNQQIKDLQARLDALELTLTKQE